LAGSRYGAFVDDLRVSEDLVIPARELTWRFDPSGGPGGQHANRSATRVELRFDVTASSVLSDDLKARVLSRLGGEDGVISVQTAESRSQWRNRQIARRRLASILVAAMRPPPPARRRTKPTRAARERRLSEKRVRAEKKRLRKPPEPN
jgi:ribosome-associated protein